jgi:hypothetical protein
VDARVESVAAILRDAGSNDVKFSDDPVVRAGLFKARKAQGGLLGQVSPDFLVQDAVIPKRALAEVLALVYEEAKKAGLPAVTVMHAGDGNLHPNFLFDSRRPGDIEKVEAISARLMERVVAVGIDKSDSGGWSLAACQGTRTGGVDLIDHHQRIEGRDFEVPVDIRRGKIIVKGSEVRGHQFAALKRLEPQHAAQKTLLGRLNVLTFPDSAILRSAHRNFHHMQ